MLVVFILRSVFYRILGSYILCCYIGHIDFLFLKGTLNLIFLKEGRKIRKKLK